MKKVSADKISLLLSSPVLNNLRIFPIFCILFFIPEFIYRLVVIPQYLFAKFHLFYSIGLSITYSYVLCVLLRLFNEQFKKNVAGTIVFLLWLITTLKLCLIIFIKNRFTPFIVQVASETNSRETEFLLSYITKTPVIVFLTVAISFLFISISMH